jgi:hypothetical protein
MILFTLHAFHASNYISADLHSSGTTIHIKSIPFTKLQLSSSFDNAFLPSSLGAGVDSFVASFWVPPHLLMVILNIHLLCMDPSTNGFTFLPLPHLSRNCLTYMYRNYNYVS